MIDLSELFFFDGPCNNYCPYYPISSENSHQIIKIHYNRFVSYITLDYKIKTSLENLLIRDEI